MFKRALSCLNLIIRTTAKPLNLQYSTRPTPKIRIPRISCRTLTALPNNSKLILPLDKLPIAIALPIAKKLPSLDNPQLESEIFGKGSEPGYSTPNVYRQSFHPERLEFLGDRLFNYVAAKMVFILVPNSKISYSGFVSNQLKLRNEQMYLSILVANETAASFANRYREFDIFPTSKHKADRFEAYLAGLSFVKGDDAVVDFLAPLFKFKIDEIRSREINLLPALSSEMILPSSKEGTPLKSGMLETIKSDGSMSTPKLLKNAVLPLEKKINGIFPPRVILKPAAAVSKSTSSKSPKLAPKFTTPSKKVTNTMYPKSKPSFKKSRTIVLQSNSPGSTSTVKTTEGRSNRQLTKLVAISKVPAPSKLIKSNGKSTSTDELQILLSVE